MLRRSLTASLGVCLAFVSCSRPEPPAPLALVTEAPPWVGAAASADVGRRCADVGAARVCWTAEGPDGVRPVPPVPMPEPVPPRGYRCTGAGSERRCRDRGYGSDDFACSGTRCTQRHPRLPDDGEWECAELSGAVICRSLGSAAGVVAGPPDPGWWCGARRGAADRICIDFAPDLPAPNARCHFAYEPGQPKRVCTSGAPPLLGGSCEKGCPLGSVCKNARCLPLAPRPSCWTDKDCDASEKCALGSCLEVAK